MKRKWRPNKAWFNHYASTGNKAEGFVPGLKNPEPVSKILTATNEFWSHSCVWKRRDGVWFCAEASGPLNQLKGLNEQQAKVALLRMGCSWTWG